MRRLAICLAAALAVLAPSTAFADASPPPPGLEPRDDALRAWLTGVWVYVPRPQGSGAVRAQACRHGDPHVTPAAGFQGFGPYAIRLAFGADRRGIVTSQALGTRTGQNDVLVPFTRDYFSVTYHRDDSDKVIAYTAGDGINTILVALDDHTALVAQDPMALFQGAWLLTKCPETPG
jgi:hypothetical protein